MRHVMSAVLAAAALSLSACGDSTGEATPSPQPAKATVSLASGPEVGELAPQAKVETKRRCGKVVRVYYERDSPLEEWVKVGTTPRHPCRG